MTTSIETATTHDFTQGAIAPELAMSLLEGMEGDTASADKGGEPAPTPDADDNATKSNTQAASAGNPDNSAATPNAEQFDAANAVVLAKDGKHTIPYEKLEQARQGEQHWKAQAEAAQQALAELQAAAQAREDAGQAPTNTDMLAAQAQAAIDAGVDPTLFGDFSEESLTAGLFKMRDQMREELRAEIRQELAKELAPLREQREKAAADAHQKAIFDAFPNAVSIVQSQEFEAWTQTMPKSVADAIWGLFDPQTGGTAQEIVAVLDSYAKATGMATAASSNAAPDKAAAQAAAAAARFAPPSSLSSIPGGRTDARSPDEQLGSASDLDKFYAMQERTPEQVEAWLSRAM